HPSALSRVRLNATLPVERRFAARVRYPANRAAVASRLPPERARGQAFAARCSPLRGTVAPNTRCPQIAGAAVEAQSYIAPDENTDQRENGRRARAAAGPRSLLQ